MAMLIVQAPLLRIPAKSTEEVDLGNAVGHLILNSYGQEPKAFAEQLSILGRARQDAVRGAGSDTTGRDLLYKWFHMLEMLELRFPELRAPFSWKDAFTGKAITQHSLAYEKASIIFNIAAILSSIAARTTRLGGLGAGSSASSGAPAAVAPTSPGGATSPVPSAATTGAASSPGTKAAYTSLRQAAGMLTYINENFLHAPSTDMSKDVVRWLVDMQLAQATEVFWERTADEKKSSSLVSRIAAQAAFMYGNLSEEAKEWVTRSIFDKSWAYLAQVKHKHFSSLAQYHRALADEASGSHGACLVRLTLAETLAKEAQKACTQFAATVASSASGPESTLPSDAATSLKTIIDQHLAIVGARKVTAVKDNDLIYHDILPTESTLPAIEPVAVAQPISIQDIYATPEVQKVTGATSAGAPASDLFSSLVPLGVHEAASMYSEEKAKLVRSEGERAALADGQLEAALEYLQMPRGLNKYKKGGIQDLADPGSKVREWADEEIQGGGSLGQDGLGTGQDAVDEGLRNVSSLRERAKADLEEARQLLDEEAAACEKLRVQHGERWTQTPSGLEAKSLRSDLKSNRDALQQAANNDIAIEQLWRQSEPSIRTLLGGREALDRAFAEAVSSGGTASTDGQLVDLLQDDAGSEAQQSALQQKVSYMEKHLSALQRIKKERSDALTELRSRIQSDDISHLLILNRRAAPEAQSHLFNQELEKFRPQTQKIGRSVSEQERLLAEATRIWKDISESTVGQTIAAEWDKKNNAREKLVTELRKAKDANAQVRAGLSKGISFYSQLQEIATSLRREAKSFAEERAIERNRILGELDIASSSRSPTSSVSGTGGIEGAFSRMGMGSRDEGQSRSPTSRQGSLEPQPQSPLAYQGMPQHSPFPPPPPPPQQPQSPYHGPQIPNGSRAGAYDNLDAAFGSMPSPRGPSQYDPPPPQRQYDAYGSQKPYGYGGQGGLPPPPPPQQTSSYALPPPPQQWSSSYGGQTRQYGAPAPPTPQPYQSSNTSDPYRQGSYGFGAPPPPAPDPASGYGSYGSQGPPPPPLPGQPSHLQYGSRPGGYGDRGPPAPPAPPQAQYPYYGGSGGPPPPPPPPHNAQQRWQPPY